MTTTKTFVAIAGAALALAPAAAAGSKPLPPIDAGSSVPNPVYDPTLPPIDAGSALPNPAYIATASGSGDVRAVPLQSAAPRLGNQTGFDWDDAGIGAASTAVAAALAAVAAIAIRRRTLADATR